MHTCNRLAGLPEGAMFATDVYRFAKNSVVSMGFERELQWQQSLSAELFTETDFLREAAWVILCSGFREAVVRKVFEYVSLCFCDWESARVICQYRTYCRAAVLSRFANTKKIDAIIQVAEYVIDIGFDEFKSCVLSRPIDTLQRLPYIGPVTAFHLAKNLGIPTAKPDRHLQKLADLLGYESVQRLCQDVANATGDKVQVVDLVFWRYSERLSSDSPVLAGCPTQA